MKKHFHKEVIRMTSRHMKKYSLSLAIRGIIIKTKFKHIVTPARIAYIKRPGNNVGRNVVRKETPLTIGGYNFCFSSPGKQFRDFFEKLSLELPNNPTIPCQIFTPQKHSF